MQKTYNLFLRRLVSHVGYTRTKYIIITANQTNQVHLANDDQVKQTERKKRRKTTTMKSICNDAFSFAHHAWHMS